MTENNTHEFESLPEVKETNIMISRQAQEVQAAMVVAKKFPRDEAIAIERIIRTCKRKSLAGQAEYTYPRGGKKITGPTIRLTEAVAQNWGNIDYGVIELSNNNGGSEMMAYAWDLETNVRVTKIFTVKHWRDTQQGGYELKDARDIYEATANFGARRVRACIMGVIPGDVMDTAVEQCRKTLIGAHKTPLKDRFIKLIVTFEEDFRVSKQQIEEFLGYDMHSVNENDFIKMEGVYRSLRDNMSKPADFFKIRADVVDPLKDKPKEPKKNNDDIPESPVFTDQNPEEKK